MITADGDKREETEDMKNRKALILVLALIASVQVSSLTGVAFRHLTPSERTATVL